MTDLVHRPQDTFRKLVGRACEKLFPGIGRYDRVVYAKVTNVSQLGGVVTDAMKLWSCDLQILNLDLKPDRSRAVLKDVPIDPIQISATGAAMFAKPFVGLIVRMAWMNGNRAYPFIHSYTAEGQVVPAATLGELSDLLYQAIQLLSLPQTTAVGPTAQVPPVPLQIAALLLRIPQ